MLLTVGSGWLLTPESRLGTSLVRASYDWSQAFGVSEALSNSPVVIVYLDLDSHLREKQSPAEPWSRALHAILLQRLTTAGAKAVVFDIIFGEPGADPVADRDLADAMRVNGHVVLAAEISRSSRDTQKVEGIESLQLSLPAKPFMDAAAAWGVANARVDDDFVVRQHFHGLLNQDQPSLTLATAKLLGISPAIYKKPQWVHYYGGALSIPHVSYSSALHPDEVSDEFFRDKIVFIGARPMAGTFRERKDEFRNPLSAWGDKELFMPAVEVHATQLLNLLRDETLHRLSPLTEVLLLTLTAALFGLALFYFRPLKATGVALLGELAVFGIVALVLPAQKLWFPWLIISAVQIPVALAGSVLFQSLEWIRQKRKFETQRRADEAKIREQAALIGNAQDAILVQDLSGGIIYANPSAERLYGWITAELQNDGVVQRILAPSQPRFAEACKVALANGEWLGELEQTTRDGRKLMVESRCTLIKDERGQPKSLLFINTNVTEKKHLEAEFFRAQRMESIGALAGGMAHDLNNALSPILIGLQLLQKERQNDDTQRMLGVMETNTHRGADMVKQLLLFSRGRDSEKEPLSVSNLVREMERIVRQIFPKSINVAALVPADLWPVFGNATQLHQVLLNLCVNARDAMLVGGELTLAADNVDLSVAEAEQIPNGKSGRFVMLLVSDTGTGIPAEILPRIFEPFFTTKPVGQGTGLGLSTTVRIVNQHGGFLNVKSEPGHGTSFEIYLPCATIEPTPETKRESDIPTSRGHGELILLVDDEQAVREMVSLILTEYGYRVLTAANGAEAIATFDEHADAIQLILLDTEMPVMGGAATLAAIRSRAAKVSVVTMSGEPVFDGVMSAKEYPAVETLRKPFQLKELLETVAKNLQPDALPVRS